MYTNEGRMRLSGRRHFALSAGELVDEWTVALFELSSWGLAILTVGTAPAPTWPLAFREPPGCC